MKPAPFGLEALRQFLPFERHDQGCPHQTLLDSLFDLLDFDFREAADLEKMLAVLGVDCLLTDPLTMAYWFGVIEDR